MAVPQVPALRLLSGTWSRKRVLLLWAQSRRGAHPFVDKDTITSHAMLIALAVIQSSAVG